MNSLQFIRDALTQYGASLNENGRIVSPAGVVSSLLLVPKGKRLKIYSPSLVLIASGPKTGAFVCSFVEKFWYWEKTPTNQEAAPHA